MHQRAAKLRKRNRQRVCAGEGREDDERVGVRRGVGGREGRRKRDRKEPGSSGCGRIARVSR